MRNRAINNLSDFGIINFWELMHAFSSGAAVLPMLIFVSVSVAMASSLKVVGLNSSAIPCRIYSSILSSKTVEIATPFFLQLS